MPEPSPPSGGTRATVRRSPIAVTGADVRTLRSVQLKGTAHDLEPATAADLERSAAFCDAFFADVAATDGIGHELMSTGSSRPTCSPAPSRSPSSTTRPRARPPAARSPARDGSARTELRLADLARCFEGAIPVVLVTASAAGVPNVTYLSKAHVIDASASPSRTSSCRSRLATWPRTHAARSCSSSPTAHDEYRLTIAYERTERRGPRLRRPQSRCRRHRRHDRDAGRLPAPRRRHLPRHPHRARAAERTRRRLRRQRRLAVASHAPAPDHERTCRAVRTHHAVHRPRHARPCHRRRARPSSSVTSTRCSSCSTRTAGASSRIASHGYEHEGVGSEVTVGDGVIGLAAERAPSVRVGNAQQMAKYARSVRRSYEDSGAIEPGREIARPGPAVRQQPHRRARPRARSARRRADSRGGAGGQLQRGRRGRPHRRRVPRRQRHRDDPRRGASRDHGDGRRRPPATPPPGARRPPARPATSASSASTAAPSSMATTSSKASPVDFCGPCCASTTAKAAPSSRTVRCASTRPSISPTSETTSRAA